MLNRIYWAAAAVLFLCASAAGQVGSENQSFWPRADVWIPSTNGSLIYHASSATAAGRGTYLRTAGTRASSDGDVELGPGNFSIGASASGNGLDHDPYYNGRGPSTSITTTSSKAAVQSEGWDTRCRNMVIHCSGGEDIDKTFGSVTAAGSTGDIQINSSGALSALTPASGVSTWLADPTSANLIAATTNPTGTGLLVFSLSPTIKDVTVSPSTIIPSTSTHYAGISQVGLTAGSGSSATYYSPYLLFSGMGATDSSNQRTDWRIANKPVYGASTPTSTLVFDSQINGGGYSNIASLASGGTLTMISSGAVFVGTSTSTNNPAFNVTRTISGNFATHAIDDYTTYTPGVSSTGAATIAGQVTVNLGGNAMPHYNFAEPFTNFTVNGSGSLDSVVGMGITTPAGSGTIKHLFGVSCTDFASRATGTLFEAGNLFLQQDPPSNYRYRKQGSLLGHLILNTWTNEAFESATSGFITYEPWTLDGSARGSSWPAVLAVGTGAVTVNNGASEYGSWAIDTGSGFGGAYYTTTGDFVTKALGGRVDFLKYNATNDNTQGYIKFSSNDGGGVTSTVEHARIDSSGLKLADLTASSVVFTDSNKYLTSSGTVAVTKGGTGLSSLTQGDVLYASASNTLSALAKSSSSTRYLSNTGTSNNPAWAQVDLASGVTGLLPAANATGSISRTVASTAQAAGSQTTTETTLWDTPAFTPSTLSTNGDSYHFRMIGTIVQHAANTRQLKLYFRYNGSSYFAVADTGAITVNTANPVFVVEGQVTRRGSGSNPAFVKITINGATGAPITVSQGYNAFGADIQGMKLTGTCGSGSSTNDINFECGQVWFDGKEP